MEVEGGRPKTPAEWGPAWSCTGKGTSDDEQGGKVSVPRVSQHVPKGCARCARNQKIVCTETTAGESASSEKAGRPETRHATRQAMS